jgi:hypothetical protein
MPVVMNALISGHQVPTVAASAHSSGVEMIHDQRGAGQRRADR